MKILNGIAFTAQPQAPAFELGWRLWLGGKRNCEVDHHIKRSQRTPAEDHKTFQLKGCLPTMGEFPQAAPS